MNRKQKIIVSITGIFLVLMILVGLTYAYFLTKITGNTNSKSISVTTANLVLKYGEETQDIITKEALMPGEIAAVKVFSATNEGNSEVTYGASLENIAYTNLEDNTSIDSLDRQEDLVYTLECKQYLKTGFSLEVDENGKAKITGTEDGTCNGKKETIFPTKTNFSLMTTNTIDTNHTQVYTLTIIYKNVEVDQSDDMNKTFSAKVNIVDLNAKTVNNPYKNETDTLAKTVLDNAMLNLNGTIYRDEPLTNPVNDSTWNYFTNPSKVTIETDKGGSYYYNSVRSEYQNQYITYGTGYSIDKTTGYFTLTGVNTCKFSDDSCQKNLVDKYIYIAQDIAQAGGSGIDDQIFNSTEEARTNISYIHGYKIKAVSQAGFDFVVLHSIGYDAEKSTLTKTLDDHGTTYYFRGIDVPNNYLNFAGMCWRIVRIEGDGSVKLILEDQNTTCESTEFTGNWNIGSESHNKENFGAVKVYETFQSNKLNDKLNYLKSGDWCLQNKKYEKGTTDITNKCGDTGTIMTSYSDNTPMYVATLTADEAIYAGTPLSGIWSENRYSKPYSYLLNSYSNQQGASYWWYTLSFGDNWYYALSFGPISTYYGGSNRPAIQLKSGTKVNGIGTKENPYVVQ